MIFIYIWYSQLLLCPHGTSASCYTHSLRLPPAIHTWYSYLLPYTHGTATSCHTHMVQLPPAIHTWYSYLLIHTHGTATFYYLHMLNTHCTPTPTTYTGHSYLLLYTETTANSYYIQRASAINTHSRVFICCHTHGAQLSPIIHTHDTATCCHTHGTATFYYTVFTWHSYLLIYRHCTLQYLLLHTQGTATFICTKKNQLPPATHIRIVQLPPYIPELHTTSCYTHRAQLPSYVQKLPFAT
jgi:hypothetical protein